MDRAITLWDRPSPCGCPAARLWMSASLRFLPALSLGGRRPRWLRRPSGTFELRELRGFVPGRRDGVPWYGTAVQPSARYSVGLSHLCHLCAFAGSGISAPNVVTSAVLCWRNPTVGLITCLIAGGRRHTREPTTRGGSRFRTCRQFGFSLAGLVPISWLMASMYVVAGPIGVLPFAVPLMATRIGYKKIVEIRDMFTQTVKSLASRGRRQGPVHGRPLRARATHRQGPGRRAALLASRSSRRSNGAACCTTSARSVSPTRSCSSRAS